MKYKFMVGVLIAPLVLFLNCSRMLPRESSSSNANSVTPSNVSPRETGRAFLRKGENESPGFGLYSYLLFGAPPTAATRERYREAITAYLSIPTVSELSQYVPACKLNVTYLPLNEEQADPHPQVDWVLENYDYARARILLQTVGGKRRDGPYIISTYKPLSGVQRLSGQYLYQDLSSTPPRIVSLWVKEFLSQVEQERFWEERTAMQCVLRLRQGIDIAAEGLPDVQKSLSTVIAWIK